MEEIKLIKADTCYPSESVLSVAKRMQSKKMRRFYVVDKEQKLLGVVTTVDIVNKIVASKKDPSKTTVDKIMTKTVKSVSVDNNVEECLEIMNKLKTLACPITKEGKLLGVVSYQNIIASVVAARK